MYGILSSARLAVEALTRREVTLDTLRLELPFSAIVRLSIVMGNRRVLRLIDRVVQPGHLVVDVGAHVGYTALYASLRCGPAGRVLALEPAVDNVAVLERNRARNGAAHMTVHRVAAGNLPGVRPFFVRGAVSAVNSLYPDSIYASVTDVSRVAVIRLDDLVGPLRRPPRLVKIDVEGAELDVLLGMPQLLQSPDICLIVEWHPALQRASGHDPEALPHTLWTLGFVVHAVTHRTVTPLVATDVRPWVARLTRSQRPIELFAHKA